MSRQVPVTIAQVKAAQMEVAWILERGETPPPKLLKIARARRLSDSIHYTSDPSLTVQDLGESESSPLERDHHSTATGAPTPPSHRSSQRVPSDEIANPGQTLTLTASHVSATHFKSPGIGTQGYDVEEVDAFLDVVEAELSRLISENTALRTQVVDAGLEPVVDGPLLAQPVTRDDQPRHSKGA